MSGQPVIHDRGRGPEIRGTRITVYDILDHHPDKGWTRQQLAELFRVSVEQIDAALQYIDEHRDCVMRSYQRILDASAKGNPPEVQAKLAASHARLMAFKQELERKKRAGRDARAAG